MPVIPFSRAPDGARFFELLFYALGKFLFDLVNLAYVGSRSRVVSSGVHFIKYALLDRVFFVQTFENGVPYAVVHTFV